jgi:hypothetical protein
MSVVFIAQELQEFRSSGVQEFRSSGVQEFRSSGVQAAAKTGSEVKPSAENRISPYSATPELLQLLNSSSLTPSSFPAYPSVEK